jgi:hypothetical protein
MFKRQILFISDFLFRDPAETVPDIAQGWP